MPQIIFFAVVGAAAYFGYRAFVREAERVTAKIRRTEKQAANGTMGTLVKDAKTGWLVTSPSYSPEQGTLTVGPTMDNQLIRALLDHTIAAAGM